MMTKEMIKKITEVLEAQDTVESFLEEIETAKAQHGQALTELEQELAGHNEALGMADDLGQAKLIQEQIKATQEQMELVKMVNVNKVKAKYVTLADKAEAFFKIHKDAKEMFGELDKQMMANTGLGQLQEHLEQMTGFANTLNNSFAGVRMTLLETGIVPMAEQNMHFRGIHLGARGLMTELTHFNAKVAGYARDLRSAGKL